MGIRVHRLFPARPPLSGVAEQVMMIPAQKGVVVGNRSFKLLHFINGEARLRVDGDEVYPIAPGDTVVLPSSCRQHYLPARTGRDARAHALVIQFQAGKAGLDEEAARFARYLKETFSRPRHLPAQGRREFRDLLARLRREGDASDPWRAAAVGEIARQFVFLAAELLGIHPPPPPVPGQARVDAICAGAVRRLYEPRPPLRLAASAPPGPLFKRRLGMTFAQFARSVRVERAKEAMIYFTQPLSVIARRTGFRSGAEFSRAFRAVTGLSPSEYREQLWDHSAEPPEEAPAVSLGAPSPLPARWNAPEAALLFCLRGEGEARAGRLLAALSADEETALVAAANSRWQFTPAPPGAAFCLAALPVRPPQGGARNTLLHLPRGRELQEARRHCHGQGPHHALACRSYLASAAIGVLRQLGRAKAGPGAERPSAAGNRLPVDYAREYLHKNYTRPLRLAEVAWFAGVSEEHLARAFRQVTGKTVMGYLREHRLRRARALLLESENPLVRIAEECGFGSAALLCRVFRAAEGLTPGAFRRARGFCKV